MDNVDGENMLLPKLLKSRKVCQHQYTWRWDLNNRWKSDNI